MKDATQTVPVSIAAVIVGFLAVGAMAAPTQPVATPPTEVRALGAQLAWVPHTDPRPVRDAEPGDEPGIYGGDPEFVAAVEADIARFEATGLPLPPLRIYIHGDTDGCQGYPGVFDQDRSGDRIDLCSRGVILHELAHAWEHHAMTDAVRDAFLDHTGLTVWNDGAVRWEERGIELAARAVEWGLSATPLTAAQARSFPEQLYRFELLTGIPSPRIPAGHAPQPDGSPTA